MASLWLSNAYLSNTRRKPFPFHMIYAGLDKQARLEQFRELLHQRLFRPWTNILELKSEVSSSVAAAKTTYNAIGWIRADSLPDEVSKEMINLRRLVEELQKEQESISSNPPKGIEDYEQGEELLAIHVHFRKVQFDECMDATARNYEGVIDLEWDRIFAVLAATLIAGATDHDLRGQITAYTQSKFESRLRADGISVEDLESFQIDNDDFQTILVQLRALGLIDLDSSRGSTWILTKYGDYYMNRLRARRRGMENILMREIRSLDYQFAGETYQ